MLQLSTIKLYKSAHATTMTYFERRFMTHGHFESTFSKYAFGRGEGVTKKEYALYARENDDNYGRPLRGSQIQQKSGEDVKRLVRLASNLVHMCRFIWEWIYAKQNALRDTRGHLGGGFRGSNIQKSGGAVKRLDRLAPTLVHVCGFIWEWA